MVVPVTASAPRVRARSSLAARSVRSTRGVTLTPARTEEAVTLPVPGLVSAFAPPDLLVSCVSSRNSVRPIDV